MKQQSKIHINKEYKRIGIVGWRRLRSWLEFVIHEEGKSIENIVYTLVDDMTLFKMNQNVLKHNFYTDIITFDLSDTGGALEADIYISTDRVCENAKTFHVKQMDEMRRVFVHGVLHLLGYSDKTKSQKEEMRNKENYYLEVYINRFHNNNRNDF